jgi:peptidoglycan/LPS O-acetylase OafA/YrhL
VFLVFQPKLGRKIVKIDITTKSPIDIVVAWNDGDDKEHIIRETIEGSGHYILSHKVNRIKIEGNEIPNDNIINIKLSNTRKRIKLTVGGKNYHNAKNSDGKFLLYENDTQIRGIKTITDVKIGIAVVYYFALTFVLFMYLDTNYLQQKFLKNQNIKQIRNIEFLRITFACFIVLQHYRSPPPPLGWIAVEFFYIMSGFFLYNTMLKIDTISFKDFAVKKLIRLYPLYLFSFLLLFSRGGGGGNIHDIISSLLFIKGHIFSKGSCQGLWFIPSLFLYSCFWFALFKLVVREKINYVVFAITYLCVVLYYYKGVGSMCNIDVELYRGMYSIGLGYLVAVAYNNININFNKYFVSFLELYLFSFIVCRCLFNKLNYGWPETYLLLIAYFVFLLFLFVKKQGILSKILDNNLSVFLGKYSFAIYMTHEFIAFHLSNKMKQFVEYKDLKMIMSIIVGVVCYHLIEKPAERILAEKWKTKN